MNFAMVCIITSPLFCELCGSFLTPLRPPTLARLPSLPSSSSATAALYARKAKRALSPALSAALRYYTPSMHEAAFQLPAFADKYMEGLRAPSDAGSASASAAAASNSAASS